MDPAAYVRYVVLRQLDTFGTDGIARSLSGFSHLEAEANEYADKMFASYGEQASSDDPGSWAEEARDQGVEYYRVLSELRQGVVNLLAVGLFHLFEQHKQKVIALVTDGGRMPPDFEQLVDSTKVGELEYVANTVKHAEGRSARELRSRRPELFVPPILRGSPLGTMIQEGRRPSENPLGGTDLFLSENDLQDYRDAVRELWEQVLPAL